MSPVYNRTMLPIVYEILAYYKCDRCGYCCKEMPVELLEKEVKHFRKITKKGDWKDSTNLKSPCPFYNQTEGLCRIYSQRPEICKAFPLYPYDIPFGVRIFGLDKCCIAKELDLEIRDFARNKLKTIIPKSEPDKTVINMDIFEVFLEWKKRQ
jgi:Fe-S-cluster containining protein